MTLWDEVGKAFEELALLRGGPRDLYKPVIRIEYYEHDGCVTVQVGRCKSMDEIVVDERHESGGGDPMPADILACLKKAREKCGECR